ncbi:hypothetical protein RRG08_046258 [Elysia crispata]|uniref:Uncharacterized protein n=1 Tax=Elysia crispata TaxID=231223 RepID=A0AAE1D0J3_9GAST|nr:hypothetical protein RRG08_046258 [Elysia crispata]
MNVFLTRVARGERETVTLAQRPTTTATPLEDNNALLETFPYFRFRATENFVTTVAAGQRFLLATRDYESKAIYWARHSNREQINFLPRSHVTVVFPACKSFFVHSRVAAFMA